MSTARERAEESVIVVGVDGSDDSREALVWAVDLAVRRGREIVVVTTWNYPPVGLELPATGRALHAGAKAVADRAVERVANERRAAGLSMPPITVEVYMAHAAHRLLARSAEAELLVVGAGRRRFLGSTSRHVARHADCPVAVISPPTDEAHDDASDLSLAWSIGTDDGTDL